MSVPDNLGSLVDQPWKKAKSAQKPITPLPGLSSKAIEGLKPSFPGTLNRSLQELLTRTCGLDGTALGSLDFTGQWHEEESLAVFRPCLTLAVDAEGRRWIAEGASGNALPGPVWCIFPDPQVALYVSDDLPIFLMDLRRKTCRGDIDSWLKALTREARAVWKHRTQLGRRPSNVPDPIVRTWAATLPPDAYIYDLRAKTPVPGWPYGVAGPAGRFYRCGRAPIFAVSGPPASDRSTRNPSEIALKFPIDQLPAKVSIPTKSTTAAPPRTHCRRPAGISLPILRWRRRRRHERMGVTASTPDLNSSAFTS